jgi:flagellar motor protein MotB
MLLTISFSNSLLNMAGDFHLKPEGEDALLDVGQVLRTRLVDLAEIQIRGHADTTPFHTQVIEDNLELASLRSNEVYRFLTKRAQINPAETLISATSFGEFSPVQRSRSGTFDEETLDKANESESLRQANRRIELVLFFRKASGQPKTAPAGSAKRFVPLATGK